MTGEWAFFWNRLLQPDQIKHPSQAQFVHVPDTWTNYDVLGTTLPSEGYATYFLTILLPDKNKAYGLYNEGQGSAYTLWVDGHLLSRQGQVGVSSQAMIPDKKPVTVFFKPEREVIELVVQVSNFHHRKGGFRNSFRLGLGETVHSYQMNSWFVEAFSVGILFVMGLYHLFIYIFRKKNKATLYFAILCWASMVRIGVTNQSTMLFHLPMISWSMALRIEYLVFFLTPIPFVLFLKALYSEDVHRWFVRFVAICGIGFTLFLIFTDTHELSHTSTYYQIIYILEIVYCLVLLVRITIKRRTGAFYIGFASLIVFAAIIIDTLILQNFFNPIYLTRFLPLGGISSFSFLSFIFVQAILLANMYSKSFVKVETLSAELEETNRSLEQSEKKYRNIFEDSKDIIFIAGLDAKIDEVSPACEEVLGYTKSELLQMKLLDVIANQADSDRFQDAISTHGFVKNFEVELQHKNGQSICTLVSATSRSGDNGKVVGVQGSVRDITDRKQAEAERLRALKLEQMAITDPLTKIYNRRFFDKASEKAIERAKRSRSPLSVIIFDIDYFKNVNDTYGHSTGDEVLVNLVRLCKQNIRSMDLFARIGGEEFVILMPDTDSKSAQETAERLRKVVSEKPMTTFGEIDVSVSISLGIANWNYKNPTKINELLDRADQALYHSKESGRNRVVILEDINKESMPANKACT